MKGQLTAQPLAELIREISEKSLSGALRLERERAQVIIYFDKGQVVYAAANLKTLRLREYLVKRNLATEAELATLPSNPSDLVLASAFTSSGKVKQKDMDALLAVLVTDVLRVALLWTEGAWEFNERGQLADSIRVTVDPVSLMREAIQRWPANFVAERLRNQSEVFARGSNISPTTNFQAAESFLLSRLDKPLPLGQLVSLSGLPETDAYRAIYGLALSGLLEREFWQNAFRTVPSRPSKESKTAPPGADAAPGRSDNWLAASASEEADELANFLARQRAASNHYEVLELAPGATPAQIKDAYYAMARRYHPDRFHLKSGTKVHLEIGSIFARITQAYETLTNLETRASYDRTVSRTKKIEQQGDKTKDRAEDEFEGQSRPMQADHHFREGTSALEQGRFDSAMKHLASAVRLAPKEASYHAYYGKALAADVNASRLAENEIQTAVKLEPNNQLFRTMLAELYLDLKFYRRAQNEVERVLARDPKHGMANLLLRKLQKSRKVG